VPWHGVQKDAFLRSHFGATARELRDHPDRRQAGRPLYLHRGDTEIPIVDIALLAEHRGRGVGSSLLRDLLAEADAAGKRVTIHVERMTPAFRMYRRLGFSVVEDKGVYLFLERPPTT